MKDNIFFDNLPYQATHCVVNIDNEFMYKNNKYKIDESLEQYKVYDIPTLNKAEMDSIVIIEQNGNTFYFDQKLNSLESGLVKRI